jgi:glycosyltransferase involved in cell wall biosynthesis
LPIAKELVKAGSRVTILALHPDFQSLPNFRQTMFGVEVYYVAPMHVLKKGAEKRYYSSTTLVYLGLLATYRLMREAFRQPFDLIHIAKPHPMNSLAGITIGRWRRRPVFLDCDDDETASGNFSSKWQKMIVGFFERRVPLMVDWITTNTYPNQERLISYGVHPNRIQIIPNGVDLDRFFNVNSDTQRALKESLRIRDEFVISYIGTLSKTSHAVDLLIQAFKIFQEKHSHSVLLLVGGGEDIEFLKMEVSKVHLEDKVRFCGKISPEKVVDYYSISNVTVDPVRENQAARGRSPLKLFESWASGVPFVTANVGDRGLYLGDPPAGLMARAGDPESLAICLDRIAVDPGFAQELVQRGRERVSSYSWSNLANDLVRLYQQHLLNK